MDDRSKAIGALCEPEFEPAGQRVYACVSSQCASPAALMSRIARSIGKVSKIESAPRSDSSICTMRIADSGGVGEDVRSVARARDEVLAADFERGESDRSSSGRGRPFAAPCTASARPTDD